MNAMFSVNCIMCGRSSGHVRNGTFHHSARAPRLERVAGRSRCGYCGGDFFLEPAESLSAESAPRLDVTSFRRRVS